LGCGTGARHDTKPAPFEPIEEYLESIRLFEEEGNDVARVSQIAKHFRIKQPSVVQMLKRLHSAGYVRYVEKEGVRLTWKGRAAADRIIRNHRLMEVFFRKTLGTDVDEEMLCGIEHHVRERFADSLCGWLNHPTHCPHGRRIPAGKCCGDARSLPTLVASRRSS